MLLILSHNATFVAYQVKFVIESVACIRRTLLLYFCCPPNIHLYFSNKHFLVKVVFSSHITVNFLPCRNNMGNTELKFFSNFRILKLWFDRLVFLLFNLLYGLLNMTLGNTVDLTGLKHDSIPRIAMR